VNCLCTATNWPFGLFTEMHNSSSWISTMLSTDCFWRRQKRPRYAAVIRPTPTVSALSPASTSRLAATRTLYRLGVVAAFVERPPRVPSATRRIAHSVVAGRWQATSIFQSRNDVRPIARSTIIASANATRHIQRESKMLPFWGTSWRKIPASPTAKDFNYNFTCLLVS